MIIKNLTPHEITVFTEDKTTVLLSIPAEGIVPRVSTTQEEAGNINGIIVKKTTFGEIEGLPDPEPDTVFIVSQLVLSAAKGSGRNDLIAPDTGAGAVRDKEGRILGTLNFVI